MDPEIGVLVCGAKGKVGQVVVAAVEAAPGVRLFGAVDLDDDLMAALQAGPDAMVDFTAPAAAHGNALAAIAAGVAPVVGTTGMSEEQVDEIDARANEAAVGG